MTGNQERIAIACQRAGRHLALGRDEVAQAAAEGGPEEVARQAAPHGSAGERAAKAVVYKSLQAQQTGGSTAA